MLFPGDFNYGNLVHYNILMCILFYFLFFIFLNLVFQTPKSGYVIFSNGCSFFFFFLNFGFIYLFIYGCVGSSSLCEGFL